MRCPQCESTQIQRDYDNAFLLGRIVGMRKLLCNVCGHVFNGFDPRGKIARAPSKRDTNFSNRRRSARFRTHLPTSISLIHGSSNNIKASYSEPSQGHCEAINESGMGISLVGSRFSEQEITRRGRLLLVRIRLPDATIEAVVSVLNHQRLGENNSRRWLLGVKIQQISDADRASLATYLEKRSLAEPLSIST